MNNCLQLLRFISYVGPANQFCKSNHIMERTMASITFVNLQIQMGGASTLPTSQRQVTVNYTASFSPYEIAGRASYIETVKLYGVDNGKKSELLAAFPTNRVIVASTAQQVETFTGWVQRSQLDEDKDVYNPCCCKVQQDCDEIVAEVCLCPVVTNQCCALSPCLVGSWGAAGSS